MNTPNSEKGEIRLKNIDSILTMPNYPFRYDEKLVFVGSAISSQVHLKLRKFFKNKATRHTASRASLLILIELIRSYTHPFLDPGMMKIIVQDHKSRLGVAPNSTLQPSEYMTLLYIHHLRYKNYLKWSIEML